MLKFQSDIWIKHKQTGRLYGTATFIYGYRKPGQRFFTLYLPSSLPLCRFIPIDISHSISVYLSYECLFTHLYSLLFFCIIHCQQQETEWCTLAILEYMQETLTFLTEEIFTGTFFIIVSSCCTDRGILFTACDKEQGSKICRSNVSRHYFGGVISYIVTF